LILQLCVFFLIENAPIFEISIFSDRKKNLVGTFGRSKFKVSSSFRKRQNKQKKVKKWYFYTKSFYIWNIHQIFILTFSKYFESLWASYNLDKFFKFCKYYFILFSIKTFSSSKNRTRKKMYSVYHKCL